MLESNVVAVEDVLQPTDLVLDVCGWACPFNRANWILDAQPYASRGYYATFGGPRSQGPSEEWFTHDTWVQRDICDRHLWPFHDKQFDFLICSHTLEDIRDPVFVCSEINTRWQERLHRGAIPGMGELPRSRAPKNSRLVSSPMAGRDRRRLDDIYAKVPQDS